MIELFSNFFLINDIDTSCFNGSSNENERYTYVAKQQTDQQDINTIIQKWINLSDIVIKFKYKNEIENFLRILFQSLISKHVISKNEIRDLLIYNKCVFVE